MRIKSENGNAIYLQDIASLSFKEKERTTYAREFGDRVVMLDVKKRAGKNMVAAAEKIEGLIDNILLAASRWKWRSEMA